MSIRPYYRDSSLESQSSIRLAQGTTPGTNVGKTLTSGGAEWSTLVLSTGLNCQQSMRTVPGKAVLFGLISLVSCPYSMLVQPPGGADSSAVTYSGISEIRLFSVWEKKR